jgi:hypothetical protein
VSEPKIIRVSSFYQPFPKQSAFHASKARYRLFGGAAGPGKSRALLMEAIIQAHKHPKVDTLLLRRTFPELEESLISTFRKTIPKEMYRNYNDSKHVITWHNESTTRFGYSESDKDITQYQGAEFLFVGVDELTLFTLRQWQFLRSRNRCAVPGSRPCMAGASNPGNIGHEWVKSLFIDRKPAPGMDRNEIQEYNPTEYEFIAAKLSDNPVYANDVAYIASLRSLPKAMMQMFLEGDWSVAAGAYFDIWNEATMTTRGIPMKPWWPRWISIDWGFAHNLAVYWHTSTPPDENGRRVVITYREWVTNNQAPRAVGSEIARLSRDSEENLENVDAIYISPDTQQKRTDEDTILVQITQALRAGGLQVTPELADNDRVGGWMLMYQLLDAGEWVVSTDCPHAIRAIPTLTRDPDFPEDILKMESVSDDAGDSLRYGLKTRLKNWKRPAPLEERILSHPMSEDMTIRAIQLKKHLRDETKRSKPLPLLRRHKFGPDPAWRDHG